MANVKKAIAAGLPRQTALEALTIRAAEIAGVDQQLGSIEPGKIADLVITEGDADRRRARPHRLRGRRRLRRGAGAAGRRSGRPRRWQFHTSESTGEAMTPMA